MAMKLYPDTAIQDIADAIRSKNGSSDTYTVSEMAQAIEDIETGGGGYTVDDISMRDISGAITLNSATEVGRYAFHGTGVTSVSGSAPTSIETYAFTGMTYITDVNLPNVTSIGANAFQNNTSIQTIVGSSNGVSGAAYAFDGCTALTSVPAMKSGGDYMFRGCSSLTEIDLTKFTGSMSNQGLFQNCSSLRHIYAPNVTIFGTAGANHCAGCTNLISVRFPKIGTAVDIRTTTFSNCTSLKLIDFGKVRKLASAGNMFGGCSALETIILRSTTVTTISRTTDFANVSSAVTIYVPSSLKASYQANTNWAAYVSAAKVTFADLEGSPYEDTDFVYDGIPTTA